LQRQIRSGYAISWPLAEALKWRAKFGGRPPQWSDELRRLGLAGRFRAVGLFNSHPIFQTEPTFPSEWIDLRHSSGPGVPRLGAIVDWSNLSLETDEKGQPTGNLQYSDCRSLAWDHVEVDRDELMKAWLELLPTRTPSRRGRKPIVGEIKERMLAALRSKNLSPEALEARKFDALTEYGGSPNTADKARALALKQYRLEIRDPNF
jgi:hypothetical protein